MVFTGIDYYVLVKSFLSILLLQGYIPQVNHVLAETISNGRSMSYASANNPPPIHNQQKRSQTVARFQRGDQGPDETGELPDRIQIIASGASSAFNRIEQLRGPNVCRSRGQSVCCSGWSQRGNSGLCLVPICNKNACGPRGRCIKPGLCMCDGGNISPSCGGNIRTDDIRNGSNISNLTGC